jgi:hypothetical protein
MKPHKISFWKPQKRKKKMKKPKHVQANSKSIVIVILEIGCVTNQVSKLIRHIQNELTVNQSQ